LVEIKDDSLEEILEEARRKKGLFFLLRGGEGRNKHSYIQERVNKVLTQKYTTNSKVEQLIENSKIMSLRLLQL